MRRPEIGTVGDALDAYLSRHGLKKRLDQAQIVNDWKELVGPQLASACSALAIDQAGTLWVRVKSAAWMQELQMMSPTIIRELARKGRRIARIRWLAGSTESPDGPSEFFRRPNRS